MTTLATFWLPIAMSGVLAFLASTILHMVFKHHASDYKGLPDEEAARAVLGRQSLMPGTYVIPHCGSMKEMNEPAAQAKYAEGPVAWITVLPKGTPGMGKALVGWLIYLLLIAFLAAYVVGHLLPRTASGHEVFRFTYVVTLLPHLGQALHEWIWGGKTGSVTWKNLFDGVVYASVMAGCFAGFWPK